MQLYYLIGGTNLGSDKIRSGTQKYSKKTSIPNIYIYALIWITESSQVIHGNTKIKDEKKINVIEKRFSCSVMVWIPAQK